MHAASLIDMIESTFDNRPILGPAESPVTGAGLADMARRAASTIQGSTALVYVGENHPMLPVALLGAAWAGVPYVPVNYRLEDASLNTLVARQPGALVLADRTTAPRLAIDGVQVLSDWLDTLPGKRPCGGPALDDDDVAVVLYTSGTTSAPKSALLRHRHLMAYLLDSVEFGGAGEEEAVLVAVPPYHVAGVANMLSNLFAGRRLVYLTAFDPLEWLATIRRERITHAMVVPTMLTRIVDAVGDGSADVPTLRSLSYGGAKIAERVLQDALRSFPDTGFVNAYGLTETASTIAVLGPDDHRSAIASDDPAVRRRLTSAGRLLPAVELEVRDEDEQRLAPGAAGLLYVRGDQISGEYATGSVLDADGWFCTRDRGWVDAEGYLFIEGRADDTIIRGGENIAPAEIEEVLLAHPAVAEACVVGLPDVEWGHRIAAVVVPREAAIVDAGELQRSVRERLRGSKTPEVVVFRDELPHTETGKLLRRVVLADLLSGAEVTHG